jgi:glycosyltransferase involved in cell wall biosynthesis
MKISVITVNYNHGNLLEATIKSVVEQSYSDIEFIVIDGGSTDESVSIIKRYSENIAYWVSEPDKGIYHAMNKGIGKATGDYCIFLNSGDSFYEDNMVANAIPYLNTDIICGNVMLAFSSSLELRKAPLKLDTLFFMQRRSICHQALFIKTELLKQRPYDETLKIVGDWEQLLYEIIVNHKTYKTIDVIICRYSMDGVSSNAAKSDAEKRMVLEKYRSSGALPPNQLQELVNQLKIGTRKYRFALAAVNLIVNSSGLFRKLFKR